MVELVGWVCGRRVRNVLCRDVLRGVQMTPYSEKEREEAAVAVSYMAIDHPEDYAVILYMQNRRLREILLCTAIRSIGNDGNPCWCMYVSRTYHSVFCVAAREALAGGDGNATS